MLFTSLWLVRIEKNRALSLEYEGSSTCGLGPYIQDLGHIFSLYYTTVT